jgi:chondroitin AC lyase
MKEPPKTIGWYGMRTFAGGVSDGKCGIAAMDFAARRGKLIARKAWFFFDKEYVCLGSRIRCPSDNPVLTVLNQCLLKGEVRVEDSQGKRKLSKGEHKLSNVRWVYHDGVTYILPSPGSLTVRNKTQTGSWSRINRSGSKKTISKDVFSLWIDHGQQVQDGTYTYIVAPGISESEAAANSSEIQILANSGTQQAVYHKGLKRGEFVFYQRGKVNMPDFGSVMVNKPCIVMIARTEDGISLCASDPNHSNTTLTVKLDGHWTGMGAKAVGSQTAIKLSLPRAPGMAGSTVHISLKAAE